MALSQRREAPERRVENNGGCSRDEGFQREMLGRVGGTPKFWGFLLNVYIVSFLNNGLLWIKEGLHGTSKDDNILFKIFKVWRKKEF